MIDMHHDLLSIMYYCYLRDDYSYLDSWIKNFNSDNVSGLLANLYFMNREEMDVEIGKREINVVDMFKKSVEIFKKYLPREDVIFSIEGCDYIKDTNELTELYNLGLRNILLVWNNPNKYGSGNRGDYGLTECGKEFIRKAIELGISIDLSHMNKKTFYDTIDLIREEISLGHKVKVIASHSNSFNICHHMRNLDDEQIKALGSVNGILGIVGYGLFVRDEDSNLDLKELYLKHIKHAVELLGIDNVGVSTDDMGFAKVLFNEDFGEMVFDYLNVKDSIRELLSSSFSEEEIDKILYKNVYNKLFREENL
jgi:membrane dipeptidase